MQDKVVLITGGAAGIGRATAQRFAQEGAKVVICDLSAEAGEAFARELDPSAAFYQVDVTDAAAVRQWVADVIGLYRRIDVLINNAGIVRDSQLVKVKEGAVVGEMSEADFDLVVAVNLKGVYNCTQAVVPHMIEGGGGVILNASSVVGLDGNFGQTNYVATKAGVVGMTKVWARELGK
jgi:3-oxoacyl-[acyl-carrier protein] reductase